MADALAALARAAGIVPSYTDQTGRRRRTGRATMRALLRGLGLPADTEAEVAEALAELRAEAAARTLPQWSVVEAGMPPGGPAGRGTRLGASAGGRHAHRRRGRQPPAVASGVART